MERILRFPGRDLQLQHGGSGTLDGKSTTIPVFIIPVVLNFKTSHGTTTFSPLSKLSNGQTAVSNTTGSPIFNNLDFKSAGVDMGTTQYEDAYQRGNFWSTVSKHKTYHVLLGKPTTLPTLTLTVPAADGKVTTDFGITVGNADIFWFDTQLQSYISKHTQIVPNSLPIFITYNSYLTEFGGCCIGGYHSAFGSTAAPRPTHTSPTSARPESSPRTFPPCRTKPANGLMIRSSSTRTETPSSAEFWKMEIPRRLSQTSEHFPTRSTASPTTCRTW